MVNQKTQKVTVELLREMGADCRGVSDALVKAWAARDEALVKAWAARDEAAGKAWGGFDEALGKAWAALDEAIAQIFYEIASR